MGDRGENAPHCLLVGAVVLNGRFLLSSPFFLTAEFSSCPCCGPVGSRPRGRHPLLTLSSFAKELGLGGEMTHKKAGAGPGSGHCAHPDPLPPPLILLLMYNYSSVLCWSPAPSAALICRPVARWLGALGGGTRHGGRERTAF